MREAETSQVKSEQQDFRPKQDSHSRNRASEANIERPDVSSIRGPDCTEAHQNWAQGNVNLELSLLPDWFAKGGLDLNSMPPEEDQLPLGVSLGETELSLSLIP